MLIQNCCYIPEDDVFIKSEHRHDFVTHTFKDSKTLSIDGGVGPDGYCRRVGDLCELLDAGRYEEFCLADTETFEGWITDRLLWGHRGKNGDQPLTYRTIKELANRPDGLAHMKAIIANVLNISPIHKRVVEYWINKLESAQAPQTQ